MPLVSSPRILLLFLCIIAAFSFLTSVRANAQETPPEKTFKFSLAAVAKIPTGGRSKIIPLSENMVLHAGSLIKFYIEMESEGFLYLFHEGSRGELVRLFPPDSKPGVVLKYTEIYIPEANNWIELDSTSGKETFHLLVSAVRLFQLESLYSQHVNFNEKSETYRSSKAILDEIQSLKRPTLKGQAERPIRLAGKLRGNSSDGSIQPSEFRRIAAKITAKDTYAKSVTIDHQ